MICPNCAVQMHQFEKTGGGFSGETEYQTWELKECPKCFQKAIEFYHTEFIEWPDDYFEVDPYFHMFAGEKVVLEYYEEKLKKYREQILELKEKSETLERRLHCSLCKRKVKHVHNL